MINEAAELLGVTTATLRNWDRSGKLKARRHPLNGYRLYAQDDLAQVLAGIAVPRLRERGGGAQPRSEGGGPMTGVPAEPAPEAGRPWQAPGSPLREEEGGRGSRPFPVMIFSFLAADDRARESGADRFLTKPLNETLLTQSVADLLIRSAAEEQTNGAN